MAESNETAATPQTAWQLLAQVILPGVAGDEFRAPALAIEAVRELELPPAQSRVIREAVADAVRQINAGREAHQPVLPISITVLVSRGRAEAPDPAPQTDAAPERRGWGCFVIKHRVEAALIAEVAAHYKIELFLYPEGTGDPAT